MAQRRGSTKAEDVPRTPTQSPISPSILVYEDYLGRRRTLEGAGRYCRLPPSWPRELPHPLHASFSLPHTRRHTHSLSRPLPFSLTRSYAMLTSSPAPPPTPSFTRSAARRRLEVWGSGFRLQVLGCRVSNFWFQISGFGFRVQGLRFWVSGFGFRVSGFGFRVSGFGFRVSGFGFHVAGFGSTGVPRS